MTMRLSASSLAGTARTLVAVGTVSEAFMFLTTAAAAPRRGLCLPPATGAAGAFAADGFSGAFTAGTFAAGACSAGFAGALLTAGAAAGEVSEVAGDVAACSPLGEAVSRSGPPTGLPGR
jgi:hypothetical protein